MQNFNLGFQEFPSVNDLLLYLEKSQYNYIPTINPIGNIMTKYDLQKINIDYNKPVSRTSGSTGIPVIVPKTQQSILWHMATNIRELQWRKWDMSLKRVAILAKIKEDTNNNNSFYKKLDPIQIIQKYLERIQPHYIYTYPSIIDNLDLTKLINLKDIKTVGEIGGTSYSCEEAGTIALQCPEYPQVYHIMENIIVETDQIYGILITDLTNPIINRYALGDIVELGTESCKCGRTLPTITKIYGRVRNMLILPNGDKVWPIVGEPQFLSITNKIIRHQTIQKTLYKLELRLLVRENLTETEELNLLNLVSKTIKCDHLTCDIMYVDDFGFGKFEAFKSEVV
jgi:phenylacetate-coenzyme A ligase PaaK-like adenylate-forming protein